MMATVWIQTKPATYIGYSIVTGEVRNFVLYGKTIFDEEGIELPKVR
jgi:hypothetical protein